MKKPRLLTGVLNLVQGALFADCYQLNLNRQRVALASFPCSADTKTIHRLTCISMAASSVAVIVTLKARRMHDHATKAIERG
jgi:hypothetical protein